MSTFDLRCMEKNDRRAFIGERVKSFRRAGPPHERAKPRSPH